MPKIRFSVLVRNHPGVLQRISGLFGRRNFMDSITVGTCETDGLSRITITTSGDDRKAEQISRQLDKLIDVVQVVPLFERPFISRELVLVKLKADPQTRPDIFTIVETFRCSTVDVGLHSVVIQIVGDPDKNEALLQLLGSYGILELTRTGETAMLRSAGE